MEESTEKVLVAETEPAPEKEEQAEVRKPEKKAAAAKKPKQKIHVVVAGDTLRSIALHYYGKAWKMEAIRKANGLATDVLKVGRKLIIP